MESILKVENLEIKYHTRQATLSAVHKANFEIIKGQIVGLVGESGCGKSTIASAIMRLLPPNGEITQGKLLFKGTDLLGLSEDEMRHRRGQDISMIFQDPMTSLNPVFNIEEQMVDAILAHRSRNQSKSRSEAREQAISMLNRVGIPDAASHIRNFPHQFSGGMRQRIMIATALQTNPSLLIADEPTSALDVTLEAQITDLIRKLRDDLQTSILYITHDLGIVAELCDQVVVFYAGNVVENGEIHQVFNSPLHPYTRALLLSHPSNKNKTVRLTTIKGRVPSLKDLPVGCKFAPRCDLAESICFEQEPVQTNVNSHFVLCHAYAQNWQGKAAETYLNSSNNYQPTKEKTPQRLLVSESEQTVQTKDLKVHFKDSIGFLGKLIGEKQGLVRAVDGVDVEVFHGESLALVGESGSGKTTLGRTILRLEKPTSGDVLINGQEITHTSQKDIRHLRVGMQMIFQDPISSLSPRKTVSQLLLEPFKIHKIRVDSDKKVDELLEMVGLSSEQADKYPHQLSGGQARRVGIARALALKPSLMIADEPTAGLDVSVAAGILNLMKDLQDEFGLTYILITHNLNIINFIADRVAVMYLGKLVEIGETETLFSHPRHPYTEALMSAVAIPDPSLRDKRKRIMLEGEIPSPRNPPSGCPFHPRCRYKEELCTRVPPKLESFQNSTQWAACHFQDQIGRESELLNH